MDGLKKGADDPIGFDDYVFKSVEEAVLPEAFWRLPDKLQEATIFVHVCLTGLQSSPGGIRTSIMCVLCVCVCVCVCV